MAKAGKKQFCPEVPIIKINGRKRIFVSGRSRCHCGGKI